MPIQTLIIPPWLLLHKMIISQLELGPPVRCSVCMYGLQIQLHENYLIVNVAKAAE